MFFCIISFFMDVISLSSRSSSNKVMSENNDLCYIRQKVFNKIFTTAQYEPMLK